MLSQSCQGGGPGEDLGPVRQVDQEERALQAVQVRLATKTRRGGWRTRHRIVLILSASRSKHVILFVLPAKYGYEGILGHVYQVSVVSSILTRLSTPDDPPRSLVTPGGSTSAPPSSPSISATPSWPSVLTRILLRHRWEETGILRC